MEKKQSSIDWLVDQLEKDANVRLRGLNLNNLLEQAKAMHKEEIKDAFANGVDDEYEYHINVEPRIRKKAEKYYNETFGGQDNE